VFGVDLQHTSWQYVIVTEGVFDALSIGGVAVLHAEVNDAQVKMIRNLNRQVIVVPDQDTTGMKLVDRAIELGWSVSMPDWPEDIKDVNDAVRTQGRLATLLQIMQNCLSTKLKIELRKRQIEKKLA
jgi:DNA primase